MAETWHVMDTGLRAAAQNIALDRALLEARHAEEIPSTLRFCRFTPSVLLATRQSVTHETDPDFCRISGIGVQRRITGGDAVYCDGAQLGWALYLHQRDVGTSDMRAVARRICHAVAAALGALGADARYRAPNDIAVEGRRIGAAGGVFEGAALLFQGVLYFDLNIATVLSATRTPGRALADHAVEAARARMGDLKTVLAEVPAFALVRDRLVAAFESEFAIEFQEADLSLTEHARYQRALAETATPGWINLVHQPASEVTVATAGHQHAEGMLHANVLYDRAKQRIKQVWFTGDGKRLPARALLDLEAALNDTAVERLERNMHAFFSGRALDIPALTAADFIAVLRRALQLPLVVSNS
jgi:lipoate-protein ligase A